MSQPPAPPLRRAPRPKPRWPPAPCPDRSRGRKLRPSFKRAGRTPSKRHVRRSGGPGRTTCSDRPSPSSTTEGGSRSAAPGSWRARSMTLWSTSRARPGQVDLHGRSRPRRRPHRPREGPDLVGRTRRGEGGEGAQQPPRHRHGARPPQRQRCFEAPPERRGRPQARGVGFHHGDRAIHPRGQAMILRPPGLLFCFHQGSGVGILSCVLILEHCIDFAYLHMAY